jgi:hypothetical protein
MLMTHILRRSFAVLIVMSLVTAPLAVSAEDKADKPKVAKPATVKREEWGSQPQPLPEETKHTPKFITIHHGGTDWKPGKDPAVFVKSVQGWGQREKNWPDLPYHYMIAPDGRIFEARPLEYAPQSNTKYDLPGHLGIELMGNFETQRPSEAQLKSLVAITAWLSQEFKIDPAAIAGHRDRAQGQTACPGKDLYRYLDDGQFIGWVKKSLAGEDPGIKPGEPLAGGPTVVIDTPAPASDAKK